MDPAVVHLSHDLLTAVAEEMLRELREGRLEVVLVKPRRVAQQSNAAWYRAFCESYKAGRKKYPRHRTYIKRAHTEAALRRIISGTDNGSVYASRLKPFILDYAHRVLDDAYWRAS